MKEMCTSDLFSPALTYGVEVIPEKTDIVVVFSLPFVTFKARTSGVLLVAGVGSYMVYRMFIRLLGRNFMWTLVDQARIDTLNLSEIRLLHPANVMHGEDVDDVCSSIFAADDECSDSNSVISARTNNTFLSSVCSPSRRRYFASRSVRGRSYPAISTPKHKNDGGGERFALGDVGVGVNDDRKETMMRRHIHCRRLSARSESEASRGLSQISATPSEKSASLRLVWDDPQWDSGPDCGAQDVMRRGQSISPSDISEMSEFVAARNIFGDIASSKIDDDFDRTDDLFRSSESTQDDTTSESMQQAHELIERSCMTDSHHLYQITTGCITSSDAVSVSSERSTRSFLALRQRAATSGASMGLLELTRCPTAQSGGLEGLFKSMTDSAISKDTATTSSAARNTIRSGMLDSAIGTDFLSSEDESCAVVSISGRGAVMQCPMNNNSSILRRTNLNLINEDQQSVSERSLEWFDDEFGIPVEALDECTSNLDEQLPIDLNILRLHSSEVYDSIPEDPKASTSLEAADCELQSGKHLKHDSKNSSRCSSAKKSYHLHGTRDLIVWAREQYSADSSQLKMLQTLYTSKKRLKRIGVKCSEDMSTHLLMSVLHSAVYHNLTIFPCSNFSIVEEAIVSAFARYDFLKQWSSSRKNILPRNQPSDTAVGNDVAAVNLMRILWDAQSHVRDGSRLQVDDEHGCVEALRLLLVLRAIDVFECLDGHHSMPRSFYSRLFANHNPRQIMCRIDEGIFGEDELCLLADTLRIRLEVLDCTRSSSLNDRRLPVRSYPDAENTFPVLAFLKASDYYLYPVYHVAD